MKYIFLITLLLAGCSKPQEMVDLEEKERIFNAAYEAGIQVGITRAYINILTEGKIYEK